MGRVQWSRRRMARLRRQRGTKATAAAATKTGTLDTVTVPPPRHGCIAEPNPRPGSAGPKNKRQTRDGTAGGDGEKPGEPTFRWHGHACVHMHAHARTVVPARLCPRQGRGNLLAGTEEKLLGGRHGWLHATSESDAGRWGDWGDRDTGRARARARARAKEVG
jgi:hypothetical protein